MTTIPAMQNASPRTTTILVVDDLGLVRDSIKGYLEQFPEFKVAGIATNADQAVSKVLEFQPDIVLMDIDMPGLSCFDAIKVMRLRAPRLKIILVSAYDSDAHIQDALKAEVNGFVAKHDGTTALINAIRTVGEGRMFFSSRVMQRLVISQAGVSLSQPPPTKLGAISPRERELLRIMGRGLSLKDTAKVLGISCKTADKQKTSLMTKLGVHNRVELARLAIREGLVKP